MMKNICHVVLIDIAVLCITAVADPYVNPADINDDQTVDTADLALMIDAWLSTDAPTLNWNAACDIAQPADGIIDGRDLAVLTANWRWTRPEPITTIGAGSFIMGDHFAEGLPRELPLHEVYVDALEAGTFEITNGEYCEFLNSVIATAEIIVQSGIVYPADGPEPWFNTYSEDYHSQINYSHTVFTVRTKSGVDMSDHPVVEVSWYGAAAYCNWLSQRQQRDPCYDPVTWQCDFSVNGYRLPTEAEWEYIARGGHTDPYTRYPWGDTITGANANFSKSGDPYTSDAPPQTTPIGYYNGNQIPLGRPMANGFGISDVAGNVWEWCNDFYSADYYAESPIDNPLGPQTGTWRVLRGGSYTDGTDRCRLAYRYYDYPEQCFSFVGFRIVRNAD